MAHGCRVSLRVIIGESDATAQGSVTLAVAVHSYPESVDSGLTLEQLFDLPAVMCVRISGRVSALNREFDLDQEEQRPGTGPDATAGAQRPPSNVLNDHAPPTCLQCC